MSSLPSASRSRSILSFSDSIRRGTATTTETRSCLMTCEHLGRIQRVLKDDGRRQQLRQKDAEELSEDVAERQQVEKAQRMKDALVLQILADLALQRLQVGQDVAVRDDDAARLGRRAGGEDDLHDVVARERRRSDRRVGVRRELLAQRFQIQARHARDFVVRAS